MFHFVTYVDESGNDHCIRFFNDEGLWEWLQDWRSKVGAWPKNLCVYKGECIFDAS